MQSIDQYFFKVNKQQKGVLFQRANIELKIHITTQNIPNYIAIQSYKYCFTYIKANDTYIYLYLVATYAQMITALRTSVVVTQFIDLKESIPFYVEQ